MTLVEWAKTIASSCSDWAEFFSEVAGDKNPVDSLVGEKALEWGAFLKENFAPKAQRQLLAVVDEGLRAQVVRAMQSVLALHKRLAASVEAKNPAEVSEVMLSIDSALQQLATGLARVDPSNVDEEILKNLPELPKDPDSQVTRPEPGRTAAEKERDAEAIRQLQKGTGGAGKPRPGSASGARPRPGSASGARPRPGSASGARPRPKSASGARPRPGSSSGARPRPGSASGARPRPKSASGARSPRPGSSSGARPRPKSASGARRPRPGSSSGAGARPGSSSGAGARPGSASGARPRPGSASGARPTPTRRPTSPPPRRAGRPKADFVHVQTQEDQIVPLTQKKGESGLIRLPTSPPADLSADYSAEGDDGHTTDEYLSTASRSRATAHPANPLKPAALDPRVALLRTYVKRLDREVLGPEEDAALEQVLAILSGALSSSEETLARRFRFLDQQFAADDASLFSKPLLEDLRNLLSKATGLATARLAEACSQSQTDRLLFLIGEVELRDTSDELPVVSLARSSGGLRPGLLPTYLPRLRGPSAGFTFHVGVREGAAVVRPVPENRLELGFIAGATRLWLTAFHVLRLGTGGPLNIEPSGDDLPAYFEARLTLPATEETYAVAQRFVLAETARFVDRIAAT